MKAREHCIRACAIFQCLENAVLILQSYQEENDDFKHGFIDRQFVLKLIEIIEKTDWKLENGFYMISN
ncbi:unnamed protein product, partial [Didymodactylos carnosus]